MKKILIVAMLLLPGMAFAGPVESFSRRISLQPNPGLDYWVAAIFLDRDGNPATTFSNGSDWKNDSPRLKWLDDGQSWLDLTPDFWYIPGIFSSVAFDSANLPHMLGKCPLGSQGQGEACYTQYGPDGWVDPIVLSPDNGTASGGPWPQIVTDSTGTIHAFFNDSQDIMWARLDDGVWSEPVNITNYSGSEYQAQILWAPAVDDFGGIHVVATESRTDYLPPSDLIYLKYDGANWSAPESLPGGGSKLAPDIAVDSAGRPHVVWYASASNSDVIYSMRDGSWSPPLKLSHTSVPAASEDVSAQRPDIAIDSQGRPHVVWVEYWYGRSQIVYSRGIGGGEWEGPDMISTGGWSEMANVPHIAINDNDRLHLVFTGRDNYADTGYHRSVYYSSLDLTQNVPLNDVWVPPVEAPLGVPAGIDARLVGERGTGRYQIYIDRSMKMGESRALWEGTGTSSADVTAALYALTLSDPEAGPQTVFESRDPWVIGRDYYPLEGGFDLSGDYVVWVLPNTPAAYGRDKDPEIEGINLASGATIIDGIIGTNPLVNKDRVVYFNQGNIYFYGLADGTTELFLAGCEEVYSNNQKFRKKRMALNDEYMPFKCGADGDWNVLRFADGAIINLDTSNWYPFSRNLTAPLLSGSSLAFAYRRADLSQGIMILSLIDGSTHFVDSNLGDMAVPLAFSGRYVVARANGDEDRQDSGNQIPRLYLYDLGAAVTYPRLIYQDTSLAGWGVDSVAISGEKILIGDNNREGLLLLDIPYPLPPTELVAAADVRTAEIELSWNISPSPDIITYQIYEGDSPSTIDYSNPVASVDQPGASHVFEDRTREVEYCYGLRGVTATGSEYSGPGLVACATVPVLPDTDDDGMDDFWEEDHDACGLDPLSDDAQDDADGDWLTNLDEYLIGSDPCNPDTDGDCMIDGEEVQVGSDPLNPLDQPGCGAIVVPPGVDRARVTLLEASAGLDSEVWLAEPQLELLIKHSLRNVGKVVSAPLFEGDQLVFFIRVHGDDWGLGTYDHYSDTIFARVRQLSPDTFTIGFEDLPVGIADWDYNDAILLVELMPQPYPSGSETNYLGEFETSFTAGLYATAFSVETAATDGFQTQVSIPAGALTSPASVILTDGSPELYADLMGQAPFQSIEVFRKVLLSNGQVDLDPPATMTITYGDADQNGLVDGTAIAETSLALYSYNEDEQVWERLDSQVNTAANVVSALTSHFSLFALGANPQATKTNAHRRPTNDGNWFGCALTTSTGPDAGLANLAILFFIAALPLIAVRFWRRRRQE